MVDIVFTIPKYMATISYFHFNKQLFMIRLLRILNLPIFGMLKELSGIIPIKNCEKVISERSVIVSLYILEF